jgi:hypothetical protein
MPSCPGNIGMPSRWACAMADFFYLNLLAQAKYRSDFPFDMDGTRAFARRI